MARYSFLLALLLTACGQAGDLYIPTEPPVQPEAAAPAAPAASAPATAPEDPKKKKD